MRRLIADALLWSVIMALAAPLVWIATAHAAPTATISASPTIAKMAGQRDSVVIEGRCHAAANGTTKTETRRRPRSHQRSGSASSARNQSGSLKWNSPKFIARQWPACGRGKISPAHRAGFHRSRRRGG